MRDRSYTGPRRCAPGLDLEIRASRTPFGRAVELLVVGRRSHPDYAGPPREVISVGTSVTMEEADLESCVKPTLTLGHQAAQSLMHKLWQCGLRPSEGTGSAGSLAATERHLKDMQTIAMGLLRKDSLAS